MSCNQNSYLRSFHDFIDVLNLTSLLSNCISIVISSKEIDVSKKQAPDSLEVENWIEEEETADLEDQQAAVTEDPASKYARSQLRVIRETKDYQLDYLKLALSPISQRIDTSPSYQRRLRWTNQKRSRLIESFLLNIPVPPIFLYEHDYNDYEVIDGRQRLETIREFLANNFALTGLEYWPELNRRRFNELPTVLQKGLLRRSLQAVVLLAESHDSTQDNIDVRRVLFDRLNTGGIRLNPQELRNALYPGPFNALLIQLARSEPFTNIWDLPPFVEGEEVDPSEALLKHPLYATLTDAELVLRFFALRDAIVNDGKGSLRRILDRFMKGNANADAELLASWEVEFISLISRLYEIFGEETFRLPKTHRLSRPLYDSLMIALSLDPDRDLRNNAEAVRSSLAESLSTPDEYDILVGRGNTIEALHQRVELAGAILSAKGQ